jgi:biotin carboxyl carrier protein
MPTRIVMPMLMGLGPGIIRRPRAPTTKPPTNKEMRKRSTPVSCLAVTEIRAEITANVWQVPVEPGQQVAEGDTIAILESMKMEIPVESPVAGTVVEVRVKPDDQVQEGDVIAVVE